MKKYTVILSVFLFLTGLICLIVCIIYNSILDYLPLDIISGALMIAGLLLFCKNLKKPEPREKGDSEDTVERLDQIITEVQQKLKECQEETYGDADEGREVISMTSETLGTFVYRRKPEWYEAECTWCGTPINVCLVIPDGDAPEKWLRETEVLFAVQKEIDSRLRTLAEERLYEMQRKCECPDELADTKPSDFAARIIPDSLDTDAEAGFLLYYDDDIDLSGCQVIAHISADRELQRIEIRSWMQADLYEQD